MNHSRFVHLFGKLFTSSLSDEQWDIVLEEWDTPEKIQWTMHVDGIDTHLLGRWSSVSLTAQNALTLTQRHPPGIWTTPDAKGKTALDILIARASNKKAVDNEALTQVVALVPPEDTETSVQKHFSSSPSTNANVSVLGQTFDFWKGALEPVAGLCALGQFRAAGAFLAQKPQLLAVSHQGHTAGTMMGDTARGWSAYLNCGGSPFDAVPSSSSSKPKPLWQWLMHNKVYHEGLKNTLDSILIRIAENRAPEGNETVLSDADWAQAVNNRHKILAEKAMIEFENSIGSDWKAAIKNNKKWREWRSSEGANFMHWLAANRIAEFIRIVPKVKRNHALMAQSDDKGCDILSYILVGALTGNFGRWRTKNKLLQEVWPDMLKVVLPMANTNPQRGILALWSDREQEAFFGAREKLAQLSSSHMTEHEQVYTILKNHPALMWNGLDDNTAEALFRGPASVRFMHPMMSSAMLLAEKTQDHKERFSQLSVNTQLAVAVAASSGEYFYRNSGPKSYVAKQLTELMQQENTLSSSTLTHMLEWMKSSTKSWNRVDVVEECQAWLSQQIIQKTLAEQPSVEHVVGRKQRRM